MNSKSVDPTGNFNSNSQMRESFVRVSFALVFGIIFILIDNSLSGAGESSKPVAAEAANVNQPTPEEVAEAVDQLVNAKDWREAIEVQKELGAMGEVAISSVIRQAKTNKDAQARMRSFEVLIEYFPEASEETIAQNGLRDVDDQVRYYCAWHTGEQKIYGGHRSLRRLMDDPEQPDYIRQATTKSLAELGEPDVIVELVKMMQDDRYMPRHMGNLGAKGLTGKKLNDFGDYEYGEGALVSGGIEMIPGHVYPSEYHEHIAERHQAIADYCKWLEKEKPAIFKHLFAPW